MPSRRRRLVTVSQWATGAWLLAGWRVPPPAPALDGAPTPPPAPESPPVEGAAGTTVSVLIPARNEAAALPHLLRSLGTQQRPADQVLVIDDASTDGTGALARAAGVEVVASAGPPEGWSGKCWALHQGQAAARGELLVFLDADVTLSPDGLGRIVAAHDRLGGSGIVSAEPWHRTARPYEQLSAVANVVALMGTGAFAPTPRWAARRGRSWRQRPMAFGPCLAIDRRTYDEIGGHAHPDVRSKITEDLALAQRAHRAGRPVEVFAGGDAVAFRMYPEGVRQLVDGWTKVLATGAGGGPPWAAAAVGWWVTGALLAAASGGRAARRAVTATRPTGPAPRAARTSPRADALVYTAWAAQMAWHFRRVGRFGPLTGALFPLPLAAFVACSARSAYKIGLGRQLEWRGRTLTGR